MTQVAMSFTVTHIFELDDAVDADKHDEVQKACIGEAEEVGRRTGLIVDTGSIDVE